MTTDHLRRALAPTLLACYHPHAAGLMRIGNSKPDASSNARVSLIAIIVANRAGGIEDAFRRTQRTGAYVTRRPVR
jgi:hypothetical protein